MLCKLNLLNIWLIYPLKYALIEKVPINIPTIAPTITSDGKWTNKYKRLNAINIANIAINILSILPLAIKANIVAKVNAYEACPDEKEAYDKAGTRSFILLT